MTEELKILITAETSKLKKETEKAQKEVKSFAEQVEKAKKDVDDKFSKIGENIGNTIKSGCKVAATAIAGAGAALLTLSATTKEYRENQAKLNTAFEAAGATADVAKNTYNELYRVLGEEDRSVEAANHLAKLTTNQQDLSQWTNICQGVFATFGDSLPIEGLTEAANETARVGQVTGPLADALNWAGVSEDAFNEKLLECATTQEREALIRETLNGLYNEAAAGYEKNASGILAQNEAQAKLQANLAKIGEAMQPLLADLTTLASDVLAKIVPYIQQIAETYGPTLKEVLSTTATIVKEVIGYVVNNWEIIAGIAGVITGIAIAIGLYNAVAAIKAAMTAAEVTTVWALVSAYAAQAAAMAVALAPYLLIVAAIAAVIAIIVLCVKHWDDIKKAGAAAWEWIKKAWEKVATWFNEKVVQPIVQFFTTLWSKITSVFSKVGSWFKEQFQNAVNNVKNVFSSITNFFSGIWNSIKSIFSNVGSAIAGAITNTVKTAINNVLSTATSIINGFIKAINVAIGVINAIPGVKISKLSTLSVPKLAEGGIVDSATLAVVGEQGKEAIVPLENNTEWIDKIADKLGARQGNTPVILQVDGKTFAETSINTINALTRQTGSLKLNLI